MEEKKTPLLKALKVTKSFSNPDKVEVLKGVNLEVYPGESVAIMGASGEGKSTLLHILGTLELPTAGELAICGRPATKQALHLLRNQHIGIVYQSYNLLQDSTTLQNVLMPALIAGRDVHKGSVFYNRAMKLLDRVGLSQRAHFHAKLLSGGERQRAAIARALCNDPEVILADEPSGNLDHTTSKKIHQLLISCATNLGKALIIVTHDDELAKLCDKTYILRDGILELSV